jgi:hypothetical protein
MSEPETDVATRKLADILLVLMVVLTVVLVGVAGYFLSENKTALTPLQAASAVTSSLKTHGSTAISFHTGRVKERPDESPRDLRYQLLEKAGIITVGTATDSGTSVNLTPAGTRRLKKIAGVKRTEEADGSVAFTVPLAEMRLEQVLDVTTSRPGRATVEFTWRWVPSELGQNFDASGACVRAFSSEERMVLMDKYGVRFYRQPPETAVVALTKSSQGWQLASD